MKAHDLALWLLSGPDEEVVFQIGHSTYSFEELAGDFGKDAARSLDTEGELYPDVLDIGLSTQLGWKRVIKIGNVGLAKDNDVAVDAEPLEGVPGEGAFIPEETYLAIKDRITVA